MKRIIFGFAAAMALCMALTGCDNGTEGIDGDMYIDPGSYVFKSSDKMTISLRVYGAEPPFTWSVSDPSMGTISGVVAGEGTDIDAANYTRVPGAYGRNTVIVDDNRGWRASCAITVAPEAGEEEEQKPTPPKEGGSSKSPSGD